MWKWLWNWVTGKDWKSFEVHARNMDIKGDSSETSEKKEESLSLLREYFSNHEQSVGRNMNGNNHSDEVSGGNEGHVIGNWRKDDPCYKIVKNLAGLCLFSCVLWTVDLMSDEIRYLAEENYKQIMEGMSWFLLTAHYKMQKEK